ncbi:unnamed protein product [Rotaria sp. Silwood2]|nr:unnamed protein product [Rotaria sp. Silwood2]CAF4348824.1 unnamed protein product [Rotaria sp. Silwood2]
MYSAPHPSQQPSPMTSDQAYVHTSHTTSEQILAQKGNYLNDQVLAQHWYNNSGQPAEQTYQMATNQYVSPPAAQQLHLQQQPYTALNQGMQQYVPPLVGQQVTYHHHQAPLCSSYIPSNNFVPPPLMNQPMVTSTPAPTNVNNQMEQVAKRQIEDVNRSCDTSDNHQQSYHQSPRHRVSRYYTPKKMKTVTINGQNSIVNLEPSVSSSQKNLHGVEVSSAAWRFATTRYPFSPFILAFKNIVKDKIVIDEVVKHAKERNIEIKIAAYRHKCVGNDYSVLVFVEDINSFCSLNNDENWPTLLCSENFVVKKPSTPPQLCIVVPNVALNSDWEDFVQSVKEQYQEVSEVIRLKNRLQHPVRAVKVAFSCAKSRNEVLQQKEMSIDHMKYRVVEYLSPAQILICGNCCEIGHFQKNCPHRDTTTCNVCGVSCNDIKTHDCSRIPKSIRCGEDHKSTDAKCRIVKDYRAALTRNLLQQPTAPSSEFVNANPSQSDFPLAFAKYKQPFIAIKEESKKTRETIDDLREEMRRRDEESKKQIEVVEKNLHSLEAEFQIYKSMVNGIMQNVCLIIAHNVNVAEKDKVYLTTEVQKLKATCSTMLKFTK